MADLVDELGSLVEETRETITIGLPAAGFASNSRLTDLERLVSPSDFGFHNVIRRPDGGLSFIDFEYGGWDDPAKLWADFFLQPRIPVPARFECEFLDAVLSHVPADRRRNHVARCRLLWPIFAIRWVCIILNPFLPGWLNRRPSLGKAIDGVRQERVARAQLLMGELRQRYS